jgi:hypothetical protein
VLSNRQHVGGLRLHGDSRGSGIARIGQPFIAFFPYCVITGGKTPEQQRFADEPRLGPGWIDLATALLLRTSAQ